MYTRFFALSQPPFSIAPDPRYLFMSERHREALAHLLYGVGSGGGFVLLTGEIGAGKTTVCRCFLEQTPENCNVAYIFNPKLTVEELLRSICDEFGVAPYRPWAAGALPGAKDQMDALNHYLLASHAEGRHNVLIIDEAQNLSAEVLEQLRLLTNLETSDCKLLQIILIGQPELRSMLARPELEQLAQRVIARYHLDALTEAETGEYVRHRLTVAGHTGTVPFSDSVLRQIHRIARGVPRRINLLCDRALLGAYSSGTPTVNISILRKAAAEVFGTGLPPSASASRRSASRRYALAGLVSVVAVAGIAWTGVANGVFRGLDATPVRAMVARLIPDKTLAALWPNGGGAANRQLPGATAAVQLPASSGSPGSPQKVGQSASRSVETSVNLPASAQSGNSSADSSLKKQAEPRQQPVPPVLTAKDFDAVLAAAAREPGSSWRDMAGLWNAQLPAGLPCEVAPAAGLHCYAGRGGLAEIRLLGRPVLLVLRDEAGKDLPVLMTGLSNARAILKSGGAEHAVGLLELGRRFGGEFVTFWRAPEKMRYQLRQGDRGPDVDWVADKLARVGGLPPPGSNQIFTPLLVKQVREFQAAQGLVVDGVVGPKTIMHLSSAAGIAEPQLRAVPVVSTVAGN